MLIGEQLFDQRKSHTLSAIYKNEYSETESRTLVSRSFSGKGRKGIDSSLCSICEIMISGNLLYGNLNIIVPLNRTLTMVQMVHFILYVFCNMYFLTKKMLKIK